MGGTIRKSLVGSAICATAMIGVAAGPAMAGEVTGNYNPDGSKGKLWTPNGTSACAFSGQNDGFHDPREAHDGVDAMTRTQTPGGAIRAGMPGRLVGMFCNGTFVPPPE